MENPDNHLAIRALALAAVFAAVAWPIREMFGTAGINAALIIALGAIPIVLLREWPRPAGHPPVYGDVDERRTPDTWRSERWIRHTVEEGIEGLEDWRHRQDRD